MRRLELLLDHVRRAVENENPSTTDGFSNLEIIQYFNDAQDHLFSKIVLEHPNVFLKEGFISLVVDQESYDLPTDMYMGTKIKSLEYKYGSGSDDYYKIGQKTIHDRQTDFTGEVPHFYIRKGDDILINPIPSVANTNGLRLIYQRQIRTLDVRRGTITSASKTSETLNSITLDLTPTLSKDDDSVQAAADLLNTLDYICVVDKDGATVVDSIPVKSYDSTTGVITPDVFTTSVAAGSFADQYVVAGKLSTTHCELPRLCERYLLTYATFKLLRRNANEMESTFQRQELAAIEATIVDSFKTADDDVYNIPLDEIWTDE